MRLLLALAAWFQWEIEQLDVITAFLNPHLSEEIYMEPPEGMEVEAGKALRLHRTLYGSKQSPYEWYSDIHKKLITLGFRRSTEDPNIFMSPRSFSASYFSTLMTSFLPVHKVMSRRSNKTP
jgi:hypothetical protein